MSLAPYKKIREVEGMILKIEEMVRKHDDMCTVHDGGGARTTSGLPDDIVCLLIEVCNTNLREYLELSTKDMRRQQVRNYFERKRSVVNGQFVSMDVDAFV